MTEKEFEELPEEEEEEKEEEETVAGHIQRFIEDYRGKSGVDHSDHPHLVKAKELLDKMKCR